MKVRAIQPAFHDGRRVRPGDELDVPDTLTASWFVRADTAPPAAPAAGRRRREAPVALSQLGKEAPAGPLDKSVDGLV
jgi:hypothetical protein